MDRTQGWSAFVGSLVPLGSREQATGGPRRLSTAFSKFQAKWLTYFGMQSVERSSGDGVECGSCFVFNLNLELSEFTLGVCFRYE